MSRRFAKTWGLLGAALLAVACGEPPVEELPMPVPAAPGKAQLKFKLKDNVRTAISPTGMTDIKGTVYGDIFLSEDVSLVGPSDEAMDFGAVAVAIDLTTMQISTQSFNTADLAPNRYTFLGFFDLGDKTKPEKRDPQTGDPVTLPLTNKFEIEAGKQTELTVVFDLRLN